jgi:hypothetical protein
MASVAARRPWFCIGESGPTHRLDGTLDIVEACSSVSRYPSLMLIVPIVNYSADWWHLVHRSYHLTTVHFRFPLPVVVTS